jgi:hypothetical protein
MPLILKTKPFFPLTNIPEVGTLEHGVEVEALE